MDPIYAHTMARYNRWMNERLYDLCATYSDADRKRDRNAFFGSIHGILNHMLLGNRLWLSRFLGREFRVDSLNQELYADFAELSGERRGTDQEISDWAATLTPERLGQTLSYQSVVPSITKTCPMWLAVAHFFNHQTHHRGQLTTLLSQDGCDPGVTDLIALPSLESPDQE